MTTEIAPFNSNQPVVRAGFETAASFELIQRQAKMLASSDLVPKEFKGNIANCIIGLEMANRMGASPLAVLQNLYIVHGKPSWSAQFITAAINSTGHFSPLRFAVTGEGDQKSCIAWAIEKATGERLEGPPVSVAMAKAEGWYGKSGSKWQTMPDLMLRYRAATFFGRLYAPEVLMGMQTMDEVYDVYDVDVDVKSKTDEKTKELKEKIKRGKDKLPPVDAGTPDELGAGAPAHETLPEQPKRECPNSGDMIYESYCLEDCQNREGCPAWD